MTIYYYIKTDSNQQNHTTKKLICKMTSQPNKQVGNVRLSSKSEATRVKPLQRLQKTILKAVLLGDYGVGKTTLFRRIREEELVFSEGSISWNSQSMDLCNTTITTSDKKKVEVSE